MAIYYKNDFENGKSALDSVETVTENIDELKKQISNYCVDLRIRMQGDVTEEIVKTLKRHYEELNSLNSKAKLVVALRSSNQAASGSFVEDDNCVDTEYLTEIENELKTIKEYRSYALQAIKTLSIDDRESRNYWNKNLARYNRIINELKTLYDRLKKEIDGIVSADSTEVNIII